MAKGELYYADCRIDLRVYFEDSGADDINDQAIEALADRSLNPGDCEFNGAHVLRVEKA